MVWKGSEAAGNQCEQSCVRSVEKQGKSKYEKGRKDKTKIKEVEENWKSVEMGRVAERKVATGQGRWLGYSSWRQT